MSRDRARALIEAAGKGSALAERYGLYIDLVAVAEHPAEYEKRLTLLFPRAFKELRLFALDPYDLALCKLGRNSAKDRDDVKFLAARVPLDIEALKDRYSQELRPYVANPDEYDGRINLWLEMIAEVQDAGGTD